MTGSKMQITHKKRKKSLWLSFSNRMFAFLNLKRIQKILQAVVELVVRETLTHNPESANLWPKDDNSRFCLYTPRISIHQP